VFEPEGVAAEEGLSERLEGFVERVARDAMEYTMGLVKSHFPEADLDPMGDGIPPNCSNEDWEANHSSVQGITKHIMADLDL
jgi:hypothetical protein